MTFCGPELHQEVLIILATTVDHRLKKNSSGPKLNLKCLSDWRLAKSCHVSSSNRSPDGDFFGSSSRSCKAMRREIKALVLDSVALPESHKPGAKALIVLRDNRRMEKGRMYSRPEAV